MSSIRSMTLPSSFNSERNYISSESSPHSYFPIGSLRWMSSTQRELNRLGLREKLTITIRLQKSARWSHGVSWRRFLCTRRAAGWQPGADTHCTAGTICSCPARHHRADAWRRNNTHTMKDLANDVRVGLCFFSFFPPSSLFLRLVVPGSGEVWLFQIYRKSVASGFGFSGGASDRLVTRTVSVFVDGRSSGVAVMMQVDQFEFKWWQMLLGSSDLAP